MKDPNSRARAFRLVVGLAVTVLILAARIPWPAYAQTSSQTVAVTTTQIGTIQTQLSTNTVWAGSVDSAPSGQAKLNALNAPLIRIHVGDDGGAQA